MSHDWITAEEEYLKDLAKICEELAQRFHKYYIFYRRQQNRVRIPVIAVSSVSGLLSFGTTVFPAATQGYVAIGVGVANMIVALVGSIESFLKIQEIVTGSLAASLNFTKLCEQITVELALPRDRRNSPGIVYVRECYSNYEKYWEASPTVFNRVRFVRPSTRGLPIATDPADTALLLTPSIGGEEKTPSIFDEGAQWSPSPKHRTMGGTIDLPI
jgi:hypothetical protein